MVFKYVGVGNSECRVSSGRSVRKAAGAVVEKAATVRRKSRESRSPKLSSIMARSEDRRSCRCGGDSVQGSPSMAFHLEVSQGVLPGPVRRWYCPQRRQAMVMGAPSGWLAARWSDAPHRAHFMGPVGFDRLAGPWGVP